MKRFVRQIIGIGSSLVVAISPVLNSTAAAQGISGGGARAPEVLTSGNGTPLVMIQTPNAAGVSHNTYDTFDVDGRGAILNNIDSNYGRTQLGGYVQGNSNLRDGAASIIINEVVGNNPSEIAGYLEVGGVRADVIVANPYGITCDGCGFINTDHATLTTGSPRFGLDGRLTSIDVSRGHVAIGSRGLDATGVSQFDLLARTVSFAGAIHGRNVRVVAGRNNVIYATGEVEVKGDDGGAAPEIAIDSTVLGGMYADRITIRATEQGAGVRAPETMAANAGEMHITADGRLVMGQASAKHVKVRSRNSDVEIRKQIYAVEQAEIEAARDLVIAANGQLVSEAALSITAGGDLNLKSGAVAGSRTGAVRAEIGERLQLGHEAQLIAAENIALQAGDATLGREALISAGGRITARLSDDADLAAGSAIVSAEQLSFSAGGIHLDADAVVSAGGAAHVSADRLSLAEGVLQATADLSLDAATIAIAKGAIQTEAALEITTGSLTGTDHTLAAGKGLSVDAGTIALADGQIVAGEDLTLRTGTLAVGGTVASRTGALRLDAASGDLSATGTLAAAQDIVLASAGAMQLGHVQAGDALHIDAEGDIQGLDAFEATGRMEIATGGTLTGTALHAGQDVVTRAVGDILIGDDPSLAGTLLPHQRADGPPDGDDGTDDGSDPDTGGGDDGGPGQHDTVPQVSESEGPDDGFSIRPNLMIGDVWAGRDIDLQAGGRIVIGNSAIADRNVSLIAGDLINVEALQLGGELALVSATGDSRIGTLILSGDFALDVDGGLVLDAVSAPGSLILNAGSMTLGGIAAGDDLALTTAEGNLAVQGDILAGGRIDLEASGAISAERIVADGAIAIATTGKLTADTIQSGVDIDVETGGDLEIAGLINADDGVRLNSQGQISTGAVQALEGAVSITAARSVTLSGAVIAGKTANIRAGGDLALEAVQSGEALTFSAAGDALIGGDILSGATMRAEIGGRLALAGAADADSGLVLIGERDIQLTAAALQIGNHAQIASRGGDVSLRAAGTTEFGAASSVLAARAVTLAGGSLSLGPSSAVLGESVGVSLTSDAELDAASQIVASEGLSFSANNLALSDGALIAQQGTGTMAVRLGGNLAAEGGIVQSAGGLDLSAGVVDLAGVAAGEASAILAGAALDLSARALRLTEGSAIQGGSATLAILEDVDLSSGSQIIGQTALSLDARDLDLGRGTLIAQQGTGQMRVDLSGALSSTGGVVQSGGALALTAGSLTLTSLNETTQAAILAETALEISATSMQLNSQSAIQADTLAIKVADLAALGAGAQIIGATSTEISARALTLGSAALIAQQGAGEMAVTVEQGLTSTGGVIQSAGSLDVAAGRVDLTTSDAAATAALLAETGLGLRADNLRLTGPSAIQGDAIAIEIAERAELGAGAQVIAATALQIAARDLALGSAAILGQQGRGTMSVSATGELTSDGGIVQSAGGLDLSAGSVALASSAESGTAALLAEAALDLQATSLELVGESAIQAETVSLAVRDAVDIGAGGQVIGRETLALTAGRLGLGPDALIGQQGDGPMLIALDGALTSHNGIVQSAGGLEIDAASLYLRSSGAGTAALLAEDDLSIAANTMRLRGESAVQGGDVDLALSGDADIGANGQIIARKALAVQADNLLLGSGSVLSQLGTGTMSIDLTGDLNSTDAVIQSAGNLAIDAYHIALTSQDATAAILAEGNLNLDANGLALEGASAIQGDELSLTIAGDVSAGAGSQIVGRERLSLTARDLALGRNALISQLGDARMSVLLSGGFESIGGTVQSGGALGLRAATVTLTSPSANARAALIAEDGFDLRAAEIASDATSLVQSNNGRLTLRGQDGAIDLRGGLWRAAGEIDITAGRVGITDADFASVGALQVAASNGALSFSAVANAASISMQSASNANVAGRLSSPGAITLTAAGNLDHASRVTTPAGFSLTAGSVLTDHGQGVVPEGATEGSAHLGQLTMTAGRIAATGDYLVAGPVSLTANDAGIRNTGRIVSGDILKVVVAALINPGALEASNLDIRTDSLTNSGSLIAAEALNVRTSAGIVNSGEIASGDRLLLNAGAGVSNQVGGEISAHHGISRITASNLENAGTIGLLDGRLDLSGGLSNSGLLSANTSGTIGGTFLNTGRVQGGTHMLELAGLDNRGSFVTEGAIEFTLNGGNVVNTGTLRADQAVVIQNAGTIRNAADAELSGGQVSLSGTEIINRGNIIADGLLRVSVAQGLLNSGLIQNGAASTEDGALIASRLTADQITNSGDIITDGGALIVTARNSLANSGQFSARGEDSYLALHANDLTAPGKIAAEGTLELANANGGLLSELITELGDEIVTEGALIIKAARIENAGAIAGLKGLTLEGNRLINTGILYSDGDIALRQRDLIDNDGGLILAGGNLAVSGRGTDADGRYIALSRLTNRHGGVIQTLDGDMSFHVANLENLREFTTSTTETFNDFPDAAVSNNRGQWSFCAAPGVDCANNREQADGLSIDTDQFRIQSERVEIAFIDGQPSQILSGGDISFTGDQILNQYSLISAAGDITFDVGSVTNTGSETGERVRFNLTYDSNYTSISHHYAYGMAFGFTGAEDDDQTDLSLYDPAGGVLGIITDPDHGLSYDDGTAVRLLVEDNELVLDHPEYGILDLREFSGFVADPGADRAGYIDGSFRFTREDWANFSATGFVDPGYAFGTIHAGGTISGEVSGFVTNGSVAGGQIHRPGDNGEDFAVLAATNTRSASAGGALIGGDQILTASMLSFTLDDAAVDREGSDADQIEGHSGTVRSGKEVNWLQGRKGADVTGGDASHVGQHDGADVAWRNGRGISGPDANRGQASREDALTLADGTGRGGAEIAGPDAPGEVAIPGRADIDLGAIGRDNLFVVNQDPNSDYLVESRHEFIDQNRFISSDYFLDSLGFDPAGTQRRLGDGMVETWLIRDQIFDLTGRNLLVGQGSEYDQLRAMYDNAADQAAALGLVPGVTLTPAQVAALTSDIIWLEERVVSGQRVLVPQVYLTENTIRTNARGGAQIVGDQGINLRTGGLINMGGAIGSAQGRTVIASAGDITNDYGLIFGSQNGTGTDGLKLPSVTLSADGTYSSTSGLVTGRDIVISATDILITTDVKRIETREGFADIAGPIAGLRADGNIGLNAARDISLTGVKIAAGRDVNVIAGGDLTLGAVRLDAELGSVGGDNYDYFRATRNLTTDITAKGNIALVSTGARPGLDGAAHVTLAGSDLQAGGSIGIAAVKGDVALLSVADEFYSDRARKSSSMAGLKKKRTRDQIYDLSQNTVALSGQEIDIYAKGDVLAEGTSFVADGLAGQDAIHSGDLRITAETGNIDFLAVESIHAEKHEKSSKLLGGLISKSKTTEDILSDMEGAVIATTGDLDLSAVQGTVLLQGGSYTIGGNLIAETNMVYLQGIIDSHYRFEHENDNNGFVVTDETRVTVAETPDFARITTGGTNDFVNPDGPFIHIGGRGDASSSDGQFTRGGIIEALGPQGILPYVSGSGGSDDADVKGDNAHWTAALIDAYGEDAELRTASLADIAGPGSEYLAALAQDNSGRVTWGDETELFALDHYEKTVSAGVLTKAVIAIATQGMGAWTAFAVNTAVDGVISGELDLKNILKDAAFTALTRGFDLGGGVEFGGLDASLAQLKLPADGFFGTEILSEQWLAAGILDGAVQTAVYGGDLADNIAGSLQDQAINAALAKGQNLIGDFKETHGFGEGSLAGVLLHGLAGCAAAKARDGDCAAGLVAAAATELATGVYDRHYDGNQDLTVSTISRYVNPILAALASGGDLSQFNANLAIQNSQVANNYLSHGDKRDRIIAQEKLDACNERGDCTDAEIEKLKNSIAFFDDLDASTDAALKTACQDQSSSACRQEIKNAMVTMGIISYPQEFPDATSFLPDGYTDLSNRLTAGADHYPEDILTRNQKILNEYTDTRALLARYPEGIEGALTEFANEGLAMAALAAIGGVSFPKLVGGKLQPKAIDGANNGNSTQIGGAPNKGVDDIIAGGQRLPHTGGRTTQIQKTGGFDQANADFDLLGLSNVRDIKMPNGGSGRVGELPDGTKVVVRSGSSENRPGFTSQPTLEIQYSDGATKIRY